jgi:putative ABC transport system substrate-binding protein
MRKFLVLFLALSFLSCGSQEEPSALYTLGILQMNDAPTLNAAREGFLQALLEQGMVEGENIRLLSRNGRGNLPEIQKIAEGFVAQQVDLIVALSTPSLQAALQATREIPIVFCSVANPYLAGAGATADDHLGNVTGISSEGPIKQSMSFLKEVLPNAKRIGTLWTPSELNSNYYLERTRTEAGENGMEVIAVPIANSSEVLLSSQFLINKKIDAIFQISDNTINNAFEALGQVAAENAVPLFGGFLYSVELGACAAQGWDFFEMGYRAGLIALRIKNGEKPAMIAFQYMDKVLLHLNLGVAARQKIVFPDDVLERADRILPDQDLKSNN